MASATNKAIGSRTKSSEAATRKQGTERPMAPNIFRLGYLIHDVSRMRRTVFDQHMKPEGITRSQWWVLANLSRHPGQGMMSTELSKLLDVGKVTLGGLIDRLEMAGYVYRRPDKNDRRAKHIFITDAGYALIDRMRVITEDLNRQICEGLTPEEIETIERHLLHIKDNLRGMLTEEQSSEEDPLAEG
ncbi:hypothetical protein A0J57_04120 [Sphingobium sp. 22B]|uniref:MarR family winged helix-turn-helix transcriptional regulator n=1 Tax=unclassified Sphingobium TaxID=2611147 RepID=UPI000783D4A6|nr:MULTISPECIES: MarR family transcriptional regulator [unclassified Sphingobium]KXU33833.1 hypothetical protein AXW74_00670 [Sphingobium sp. AM]KYC33777.1 hypothetical protein A0J57_04120 [Sphingobium sp. 22B]OAP33515.1 hypothetical protein A8O16_03340 [Sphingobium sp. 20006FA]